MSDVNVSRRVIVKGAAWSVPVVMAAATVPRSAASAIGQCDPQTLAWGAGWTSVMTDGSGGQIDESLLQGCGGAQPEANGKWWLWCDGPWSSDLVYTKTYYLDVTADVTYILAFSTHAGSGVTVDGQGAVVEGPSSPASLTLEVDGAPLWGGYTISTEGESGQGSSNFPWYQLSLDLNYTDTTADDYWTVPFTASTTGTVSVILQWTARQTVMGTNCTDDIGVSQLVVTCAGSGSGGNN